jgi:hypothetical protein
MDVPIDRPAAAVPAADVADVAVIADVKVLQGELAIISVYCPDQLQKFQDYKDSLKTAEVAG